MSTTELSSADRNATDRILAVAPVWRGLAPTRDCVGLAETCLLHAGPAFDCPDDITKPILNLACVAAVFEGLAGSFEEARAMIGRGEITLSPAQDLGVTVPLASVLSASVLLQVVTDSRDSGRRAYAPINGGSGPALRLGQCGPAVLEYARWLNGPFTELLQTALSHDIDLIEIARQVLRQGDDLHGRTSASTPGLHSSLDAGFGTTRAAGQAREFLRNGPSFFLNLWMVACKCILSAAVGVEGASLVTGAGANGCRVGLQIVGRPGTLFTAPAAPPRGDLGNRPAVRALGAIGDSALVDVFGFGAMAMSYAPAQMKALVRFLPEDGLSLPEPLLARVHPGFENLGLSVGLCAGTVVEAGRTPVISLGILDVEGEAGRLGGDIYQMPMTPFDLAVGTLHGKL